MTTNLSGLWSGIYWQVGRPTRFEMHLIETNGVLFGSIRDLNYTPRAATLSGDHVSGRITFEKRYQEFSNPLLRYQGSVSADFRAMEGTWHLNEVPADWGRGPWKAWRSDDELALESMQETEREIS